MSRVIVLAGGSPHAHDFGSTGAALVELARSAGFDATIVDHPDEAARALGPDVDSLIVNGLWWRMEGHGYDEWRKRFGYSPPVETRRLIDSFVAGGGGLLAIHTASICFDDWPLWGRIVGGAWRWGVSSHPPHGEVTARIVTDHPVTAGVATTISIRDEVYGDLLVGDDVTVVAVAKRHPTDADQPVVWTRHHGAGRVVYDGFGHDADSIRHEDNARLLVQSLHWIARS